jgi:hypothetical protein
MSAADKIFVYMRTSSMYPWNADDDPPRPPTLRYWIDDAEEDPPLPVADATPSTYKIVVVDAPDSAVTAM